MILEQIDSNYPIIVHCHLRWEGVWQRPQQFLSRLSKRHEILFVEGPLLHDSNEPPHYTLKSAPEHPAITIMQTHFPSSRFQDGQWVDEKRLELLKEALNGPLKGKFNRPIQWFYDPMAAPAHMGKVNDIAIVYDCMDELSQFRFAPPEIITRERQLLANADVVFAGGRKMCESKSRYNRNCHFYGCGVDVKHFSRARLPETQIPEDVSFGEGQLVLGYFGVVDERLDYDLIAKLADANASWHIAMIGPTCKVDPAALPQRPNIHWLGRREYAQLPEYTKGFDVSLMPFALNEATEYINPTKALEYMATGRPIVSTAVPDVVSNFNTVVKIARTPEEFVEMCSTECLEPDEAAVARGIQMAADNQWDSIVQKLEGHIDDALKKKTGEVKPESAVATA
jgi:glycosyltransferase involved in cell wall biosynthesis